MTANTIQCSLKSNNNFFSTKYDYPVTLQYELFIMKQYSERLTVNFCEVAQSPDGPQLHLRTFVHRHQTQNWTKRPTNTGSSLQIYIGTSLHIYRQRNQVTTGMKMNTKI